MRNFIISSHTQTSLGRQGQCGRGAEHVARMGEEIVQGFGGEARRRKTNQKTKTQMGKWDQNGS
jgi:hypothetical protein